MSLWHVDVTLKISIGPMEITLSPRPHNGQAIGEEIVWAPGLKRGGNGKYRLWGISFKIHRIYTFPPFSTFENSVGPSIYIEIYQFLHFSSSITALPLWRLSWHDTRRVYVRVLLRASCTYPPYSKTHSNTSTLSQSHNTINAFHPLFNFRQKGHSFHGVLFHSETINFNLHFWTHWT
jgi:hypothetical protein